MVLLQRLLEVISSVALLLHPFNTEVVFVQPEPIFSELLIQPGLRSQGALSLHRAEFRSLHSVFISQDSVSCCNLFQPGCHSRIPLQLELLRGLLSHSSSASSSASFPHTYSASSPCFIMLTLLTFPPVQSGSVFIRFVLFFRHLLSYQTELFRGLRFHSSPAHCHFSNHLSSCLCSPFLSYICFLFHQAPTASQSFFSVVLLFSS